APEGDTLAEGRQAPFDAVSEISPRVKLARKIANSERTWMARGDIVGDGNQRHAVKPGDILILVRQRGSLFEAIIRALKNAEIAVAGADRLVLTDHIAIMDLLVLADSLLLPEDNLALATVLKSPLFGFTDDDLFAIAWNRGPLSLRQSLLRKADNPRFREAAERLAQLEKRALRETPFAFYASLLGRGGGRKLILARLGHEAADPLDEFLNLAFDYETRETPSLQGFVAWLRTASAEVKRDMEITRDEVRVMTVHGAKGLEAPIVILADTTTPPAGPVQRQPKLLPLPAINVAPETPESLVWAARKDDDVAIVTQSRATARNAAENEYRRLLYVAMTRAADRLVVCGAIGVRDKPQGCWYDLVSDAIKPNAVEEPADDGEGCVWRFRKFSPEPDIARGIAREPERQAPAIPDWLKCDASAEPVQVRVVTPSATETAFANEAATTSVSRSLALARGRIVHRLLQSLPDIAPERRAHAARSHLSRAGSELSEADREHLVIQTLRVLTDVRFTPLFAPGSRAEVPIVGRIVEKGKLPIAVSGQVDRLAVTDGTVLIADYKTNRPVPRNLEETPEPYINQLAAYRAVLRKIYPAHTIRAALVWTDSPDLMEIPAVRLDRAWAALTSS
ncbi:MAG: PD-(D/E)XK nuclease family protein, partial [Rhizobiales bacterium]|nr:PD-(D/E)XK nuclease family protein [Hyphomicrobiales bacterium]